MAKNSGEIIFVGGTDTGVGKTLFTAAFTLLDRQAGRNSVGYKGAASDCVDISLNGKPARLNEDILLLALCNAWPLQAGPWRPDTDLQEWREAIEAVAPLRYLLPAAPTVAARAERSFVDITRLTRRLEAEAADRDRVYYEGIGGLLVPLNDSTLSLDHARRLCDRCRLIGRTTLGTINHTALSVAALEQRRIGIEALYLSHPEDRPLSRIEAANASEIARVTKLPMHSIFVVEYLPATLPRKFAKSALPPGWLAALPAERAQTLLDNWARALQLAAWLAD